MVDLKIRIRLYHYHDLDLVSLYREGRISIPKAVKLTLNAFARKRYVRLETVDKKCEKIAKPVYMFNIILDEKKDKDAIDLLNKIDKGYRNNFIKQLLRVYLCVLSFRAVIRHRKTWSILQNGKRGFLGNAKLSRLRSADM